MKILTVKRLESSFTAFLSTFGRFILTYERVIAEFQKGHVFISKKHIGKIFELLEYDDQEGIDRLLEEDKAEKLAAKEFRPEFIADLENDLKALQSHPQPMEESHPRSQVGLLSGHPEEDAAAQDEAKSSSSPNPRKQPSISPEKFATKSNPKPCFSPANRSKASARKSSPTSTPRRIGRRTNTASSSPPKFSSEGVNLHRSNIVINYDIPWNPTRLIQRVGRVNRVDTKFDTIHTYNFFPTEEGND